MKIFKGGWPTAYGGRIKYIQLSFSKLYLTLKHTPEGKPIWENRQSGIVRFQVWLNKNYIPRELGFITSRERKRTETSIRFY